MVRASVATISLWCVLCLIGLGGQSCASSLRDLSDLPEVGRSCIESVGTREHDAVKHACAAVRRALRAVPPAERRRTLHRLCERTRWGTPMRAVAYYISAWYGVDYSERVKYLMNAAFWWDRGFHHQPTSGYGYPFDDPNASAPEVDDAPSNFEPGGMGLMYSLYERNLDFRLLHDIFVEHGDADRAEELCALKVGMFFHHPRGVLHVARMSRHGFREAVERIPDRCMREGFGPPNSARIKEGFLAYCRRVAGDGSDPLRGTARRLLRQVRRAHA